jgi:hypothetical protein
MSRVTFDCKKFKGLKVGDKPLKSFVIQETDGRLEAYAAARAKAKGADSSTHEEMIRASIVQVNGQEVQQPYEAMDGWNTRARQFLIGAYRSVNGVDDKELDDFLAGATDVVQGEQAPPDFEPVEPSDDE